MKFIPSGYGRHFIVLGLIVLSLSASVARSAPTGPASAAPSHAPVILVLGDSLSAEYGLPRGTGWVALMAQRWEQSGRAVTVVNASISGETTAGAESRLDSLLKQHHPHVLIIELGANDALRGLALDVTQAHLTALTRAGQRAGARVLLLGQQVPPNYGADYARRFAQLYVQVARERKVGLVPFMLKGVADVPHAMTLFQADGIHPTAQAHPQILANIWPELQKLTP
jgi:acyl-CoA thioesterase I